MPLAGFLFALFFTPPSLVAQEAIDRVMRSGDLLLVRLDGANKFAAYSQATGIWRKFSFPEGVKIDPLMDGHVCVFYMKGKNVSQLVAVDRKGFWRPHDLPVPTANECIPFAADNVAVYTIDGFTHAYSALTGTWDTISGAEPPNIESGMVIVQSNDRVAAFSPVIGAWAQVALDPKK
jgi:hypothetical protein